jgi:hypothetical protein
MFEDFVDVGRPEPKKAEGPTSYKYISRIERKHSGYGWQVRYRGKSEWFADSKFGSKGKSLIAARFYISEQKKKAPMPKAKCDIPGLSKASIRSGNRELPCYIVRIDSAGIYRRFYPHHYRSESKAIEKALEYRRAVEWELEQAKAEAAKQAKAEAAKQAKLQATTQNEV